MGLVAHLALVAETSAVNISDLTAVAAALQKQISRDLGPIWELEGTISPFVKLEDVPPGFWPVILRDDITVSAAGVHCDNNGQPFALVAMEKKWSITASHEMLEMLVDPSGNRTVSSQSVKPGQGRVDYLIEVSDPIGDESYTINGVEVSDFYTPNYFDPARVAGVRYSFCGSITAPRQVLPNGYLTWHDAPSNSWFQQTRFSPGPPEINSLGPILKSACGLRVAIDNHAEKRRRASGGAGRVKRRDRKKPLIGDEVAGASRARAELLRSRIAEVLERV